MSQNLLVPLLGLGLAFATQTAAAADISVTSLSDSGAGSLRQAVNAANATPGTDRILLQVSGVITLTSGALAIDDAVQIIGCAGCSIHAQGSRVFEINGDFNEPLARAVTLSRLRLSAAMSSGNGGAVRADFATLRIEHSQLMDTHADGWGGALYADGCDVTVIGSHFGNNVGNGFGGAIASNTSALHVERTTFSGNRAESGGGAIWANWSQESRLQVVDSRFAGNSAAFDGGAIEAHVAALRVSGSTFEDNAAEYWSGGALHISEDGVAPMEIDNSTFVGNEAAHEGGQGAAILLGAGRLRVRHVTVTDNLTGAGDDSGIDGGAIEVDSEFEAELELVNSIVAGNLRSDGSSSDLVRRVNPAAPNTVVARHNLIGSAPEAGTINGVDTGNLLGVAAGLDSFGHHGGPTPTYSLLRTSPACDAGEPVGGLTTDQRGAGFVRAWGAPDIGAYEFRGDTIFRNGFERNAPPVGCGD